jgi:hypothetical protein
MKHAFYASLAAGLIAGAAPSFADDAPGIAAIPNIAHVFTTKVAGGNGQVFWAVPIQTGTYAASFTANFFPEGSVSAPETFACFLYDATSGALFAESSVSTTYTSGFFAGVNGGATIKVTHATSVSVGCGTDDATDWAFGSLPVTVTFTLLDGSKYKSLKSIAAEQMQTLPKASTAKN